MPGVIDEKFLSPTGKSRDKHWHRRRSYKMGQVKEKKVNPDLLEVVQDFYPMDDNIPSGGSKTSTLWMTTCPQVVQRLLPYG